MQAHTPTPRWSEVEVDDDHPPLRCFLDGFRPLEVVGILVENHVRLVDLVGVVHHAAESSLDLLKKRFVHDLSIVRRSLEARAPTVDRQLASKLREVFSKQPPRFLITDVLHPVAPEPSKLPGLLLTQPQQAEPP